MSFVSQFLVAPLILQIVGTACVLSSPARRNHDAVHALTPLTISLCLWACSSLLARGADHCSAGPGMHYTPMLAVGIPVAAIIVVLATCSGSKKAVRIVDTTTILVAVSTAFVCLHQFGRIPRFTFNPFDCARYVSDPFRPVLTILQFTIPMLTAWRDVTAVRNVMSHISGWFRTRKSLSKS